MLLERMLEDKQLAFSHSALGLPRTKLYLPITQLNSYAQITFTNKPTEQPKTNGNMKTDNYLTLCLEQAAKSPLHYRHGCIIVRGGKVIGQGHNDYRPGFDGGALKHGRVAGSALNGAALAEMKAKLKERKENKAKPKSNQHPPQPPRQLAAFEKVGTGGGVHANTPLSMHSEMMAIHSAISTSSNLACSSFSHDKPFFKLPRGDKKKERLRRDVLQNYVERICETSTSRTSGQAGKLQVQECGFASASKSQPINERRIRGHDRRMIDDVLGNGLTTTQSSPERGKSGKDHKGSKKAKSLEQPEVQHLLLPQGEIGKTRAEVNDRKRHPRLAGADLYVTRLGWNNNNIAQSNPKKKFVKHSAGDAAPPSSSESEPEAPSLPSSASSTCTIGNTSSLYDELRSSAPKNTPPIAEKAPTIPREAIHTSRPCYRCVSYMHAVGIKRVFWTNDDGQWEGGKVAKFIDALDGEADEAGCGGGPMGNGVFVTKHEVLMMRRKMGD
ncbi:hypothetical protein MBLNU13_g07198t1 [Cladosporium sp. NU13]